MSNHGFNPENSFRQAILTPHEARDLVWKAGSLALLAIDEVSIDALTYLGEHFEELNAEINRTELEMDLFRSMDLPGGEVMRLDMGRLHYVVKTKLDTEARRQTMDQLDPNNFFHPTSPNATLADRMPAWSNESASDAVIKFLDQAHQQLSQS